MFCTGIENSNPTIDHGRTRIDEMESCRFYERWREDFALVQELGISFLRYGPPIHRTLLGPGRHDRCFADETLAEIRRLRIVPIVDLRPDAIFIQSESSEYFHAENPAAIGPAEQLNALRFLPLDLNHGRRVDSEVYDFLLDNGMSREEYRFFLAHRLKQHCIMGNDHYVTSEHRVCADGRVRPAGEVFGYDEITRQYFDRYRLPVMHTETHHNEGPSGEEAVNWLWKEWADVHAEAQKDRARDITRSETPQPSTQAS